MENLSEEIEEIRRHLIALVYLSPVIDLCVLIKTNIVEDEKDHAERE